MALFVSQPGETADTLAALRYCAGRAGMILSIVNVSESPIARESGRAMQIHAGPEIGVASTKAFTCQLAVEAAHQTCAQSAGQLQDYEAQLRHIPSQVAEALGRGALYPLALEGGLKLKEISNIHAEGYASGALIDEEMSVMVPHDELFGKTVSNMQEVMARGGKIVMVSDARGLEAAGEGIWQPVRMAPVPGPFAAIAYAVPLQILTYHTAVEKGSDVDQPRNLAKSVAVE